MSYNSELKANNEDLKDILNKINALPEVEESDGGVYLPDLGSSEAQSYDMVLNKKLYDSDGNTVTGTLDEKKQGDKVSSAGDVTLNSDPGVTRFRLGSVYSPNNIGDNTKGCVLRPGAILEPTNIPTSLFGSAGQNQVLKGATFTSEAGLLVPGTLEITPEDVLPNLNPPGSEDDLLEGVQLIGQDGGVVDGKIPRKSASDIQVSGASLTVPSGYYESSTSKSVNTATQATPSISLDTSTGKITATSTQSAGYVSSGSKASNYQLEVQGAQNIVPGANQQTISAGKYLTGDQVIAGDINLDPANIRKGATIFTVSGSYAPSVDSLLVRENGTYTPPSGVDGYSEVTVAVDTGPEYTVDETLSPSSTNPIQNKAVYNAISEININIDNLDDIINGQDGNSGLTKSVSDIGKSIENINNDITSLGNSIDSTISSKVQTSIAGLNVNITTYTNPSQFGCAYTSTITEVCNAIPNNSIFICNAGSFTDVSWNLPSTYGTILSFKLTKTRHILRFYGKDSVVGNYQMSLDDKNEPTGVWTMDLPSVLSSNMYGTKLPGEDGKPYTHVKGRLFFLKASE